MTNNHNEVSSNNMDSSFDLKKTLFYYLNKWPWFILSVALCITSAFFILRYTTPQYLVRAKLMLVEDKDNSTAGILKDISLFSDKEGATVDDEIEVIKSRSFLRSIVDQLNLNISFYTQGRIYESELYRSSPIVVNFIAPDSIVNKTRSSFYIDIESKTNFKYYLNVDSQPKSYTFGETIPTDFGGIIITPKNEGIAASIGRTIRVALTPVESLAEELKNNLSIIPADKSSKVLLLSLKYPVISKAEDILNTLMDEYNKFTIENKNEISRNTADFINKRVELIAEDLVNVDDSIVKFKTGNKITDVSSEAGQFLNSSALNQQQLDVAKTQLNQLSYMDQSLDVDQYDFIPSNLGMGDPSITQLSSKYNELLERRKTLMKSAGEQNPVVLELDQTLNSIRSNLQQTIDNSAQSLSIQISSLENQSNRINSKIYQVPGQERRLRSIERKQGIKESLYLYLLEKREEATISLTATSPNAKVIDYAYNSNGGPVSPKKPVIYIGALFIGLFIPFSIFYVKDLLDTKIHNKEDLEQVIKNIAILGEIPRVKEGETLIEKNDRSILSESFRIIRTNFDYIERRHKKDTPYNNVIFVTSTINGEGKSFVSLNTALTFANTNKKVLVIGADIRNPQIFAAIKRQRNNTGDGKLGLSEFLADESIRVEDTINPYVINDIAIDVLLSGNVPPNPAELLMGDRIKTLFDTVSEQYDYVIVDTAPSMLVTDTLLISIYAGHTIYLTRAEYTEKRILNFAKELHADKKLNGMMLVVNDVKESNFGYGAKYGYYGTKKKKGLFRS
ncbi:polysaccharide biosynthesis tyrosine autokinase [Gaetbulibacter sp. M240]|uniref:GumC family protein n=1 Tax=Gaetbulibacter sp. M240 TaxID=3126511 RepID=UPI00374F70FA